MTSSMTSQVNGCNMLISGHLTTLDQLERTNVRILFALAFRNGMHHRLADASINSQSALCGPSAVGAKDISHYVRISERPLTVG